NLYALMKLTLIVGLVLSTLFDLNGAAMLSRADWGAPEVEVTHASGKWTIAGKKQKVRLDEATFTVSVDAGPVKWAMAGSEPDDLVVKSRGKEFELRLADAAKIEIVKYDTGYQTGVKIRLGQFGKNKASTSVPEPDLELVLTLGLEGKAEDLVFNSV